MENSTQNNIKLLSFGEILWDVYPDNKKIGGAPFNFAAHFALNMNDSYLLSSVGDDEYGVEAQNQAKMRKIKTDFVKTVPFETGKCLVELDEKSVPTYNLLDGVAWDYIDNSEVFSQNFDVLYFGTLALRHNENCIFLKKIINNMQFKEIFSDLNIRPPFYSKESILFCLENATVVKISDEEMPLIADVLGIPSDDIKQTVLKLSKLFTNIKLFVITLGSKGAFAYSVKENEFYSCDSVKTTVVSTVGAGDSFSAAFLSKYLKNADIDSCLAFASRIASFVVSAYDAVPQYSASDFED